MGYKVTDTQRITSMTPAGNTTTHYRVWIVTDNGASGQVDVPTAKWNEKELPDLLKKEADKLDLAFRTQG